MRILSSLALAVTVAMSAIAQELPKGGPISFVGTQGLGAFLITTSEGHERSPD